MCGAGGGDGTNHDQDRDESRTPQRIQTRSVGAGHPLTPAESKVSYLPRGSKEDRHLGVPAGVRATAVVNRVGALPSSPTVSVAAGLWERATMCRRRRAVADLVGPALTQLIADAGRIIALLS